MTIDGAEAASDPQPEDATSASTPMKPWEAFRIHDFRYLWANSMSFALVQNTQRFAFVWLMLEVYQRADDAGRVAFMLGIPVLFLSMQAGALADRVNRRTMLLVTQLAAAVVSGAVAVLLYTDTITYATTIVGALLVGVTIAIGTPVRMSIIPTIVPRRVLMNAIVLNGSAQNIAMVLGPALSGVIISRWDVKGAFAFTTVLYLIGAVCLVPVKLDRTAPDAAPTGRRPRQPGAITEGLRFVVGHEGIRALFLFLAIAALFLIGPWGVLVPQLARARLGRDVLDAGIMIASLGAGTIVSTLIQAMLRDIPRKGLVFLAVVAISGVMLALVGLSTSYDLTLALMFVWGVATGFFMNLIQTLIQSNTPERYLGRVAAVQTIAMQGVAPFGSLLAGWGAERFGIATWMVFSGACLVVAAAVISVTQPALRRM